MKVMVSMLIIVLILGGFLWFQKDNIRPITNHKTYLEGTLTIGESLAPDVSYPYILNLDVTVSGPEFEDGRGMPLNQYYLSATDGAIKSQLISRLGQKIKVGGDIVWGYAETKYLLVKELVK